MSASPDSVTDQVTDIDIFEFFDQSIQLSSADGGLYDRSTLEAQEMRDIREGTVLGTIHETNDEYSEHSNSQTHGSANRSSLGHTSEESSTSAGPSLQLPLPEAPANGASETTPDIFPPLPLYGPPSFKRNLQNRAFQMSSLLSNLVFAVLLLVAAGLKFLPHASRYGLAKLTFRDPDIHRPFIEEERRRKEIRKKEAKDWKQRKSNRGESHRVATSGTNDGLIPTEGGYDPLIRDVGYYARRVGLDAEFLKVQTEDGFILDLWHIYNPLEFTPMTAQEREAQSINPNPNPSQRARVNDENHKYPVLMMHGLLQSSGAFCTTDDSSLAFYLCKSGYDIWLGHNRCGFDPKHSHLKQSDPRFWAWNIRHMGTLDLPALTSRVLAETGFAKLALIGHSQGTTQTFIALSKRYSSSHCLNSQLSIFCALAPAVYGGKWLTRPHFAFIRALKPAMFNFAFGIHSFFPIMIKMSAAVPGPLFGWGMYRMFNFLFNWTDTRWDHGTRNRCFLFAPVYVSAESMRWWLGADGFASQGCILASKEDVLQEDEEESEIEPWFEEGCPPMALWVAGSDDLFDGRKLLRRLEKREPHVRVVHSKVIDDYEHLDVIWAMDSIEKVGKEVRDCIWWSIDPEVRATVRLVQGNEVS